MNERIMPTGADPSHTNDSIIAEELKKLKEARIRMKNNNQSYIDQHPELRNIIDDFMSAAIARKPEDVVEFGWEFFTDLRNMKLINDIPLIIFTGPQCVGKTTIIKEVMKYYPHMFALPVFHTSRPPNEGEVQGKDFHFENVAVMEQAIEQGELLYSYGDSATGLYGLSFGSIENVRAMGRICLLEMKMDRAVLARSNASMPVSNPVPNPQLALTQPKSTHQNLYLTYPISSIHPYFHP